MHTTEVKLRDDVRLEARSGRVVVESSWIRVRVPGRFGEILHRFRQRWMTRDELVGAAHGLDRFEHLLPLLISQGLVMHRLRDADQTYLQVVPLALGFELETTNPAGTRFRLSRFAWCRLYDEEFVLESSLSLARVEVKHPAVLDLLWRLRRTTGLAEIDRSPGLPAGVGTSVLELLIALQMVFPADSDGRIDEDRNDDLVQWEFPDLLYHTRSVAGRHDYPIGAHFPFEKTIEPLPVTKARMSDDIVELPRADIEALKVRDATFTEVMETRRSVRAHGSAPLSVEQLGAFLYRVARVKRVRAAEPKLGLFFDVSKRPYPSGGAAHDLEIYVTLEQCEGLEPGFYHYDPRHHRLERIAEFAGYVPQLLENATIPAPYELKPKVLITLASRFARLSWKYRGFAYSATLRNTGALLQTMYLVATAMGLAPCAAGSANTYLFSKITGLEPYEESPIMEFILGTPPSEPHDALGGWQDVNP